MKSSLILRLLPLLISFVLFIVGCEKESGLPVDGDGNVYDTVVIGTQVWLKENLKTTRFRDGTPIPLVTDNNKWASMTSAAYCWYNNNPEYKENYGALYNWYAAGYACPIGWHVPTKEEWETLINYVGRYNTKKLKDTRFWSCPPGYNMDCSGSNESGFAARPGGDRDGYSGSFGGIGFDGVWWTFEGYYVFITATWSEVKIGGYTKKDGLSVRCIKNN